MTVAGDSSRPIAIGVAYSQKDWSLEVRRKQRLHLMLEANALGLALADVFYVVGDTVDDAVQYSDAEALAKLLDAEAFLITPGVDRGMLEQIASAVRMTITRVL